METVYERALSEVGENGKFQRNFDIVYNIIFAGLWTMAYMNIVLAFIVTPHNCKLPERPSNVTENIWFDRYIPVTIDSSGENISSKCSIYVNPGHTNETSECEEYDYDKTWYKSTVPMDYNWVCDKEIYIANAFAYGRIGEVIGSVIFGWLGDKFGRRMTYVMSLALLVLGRLITVLSNGSIFLFVIGCFLGAFPSWSAFYSVTVISLEISSADRRTTATALRSAAWSIAMCLMPFIYWWLQEWKWFMIVTTAPHLIFILTFRYMIESPRWLWIQGRGEECIKELKRIAKANGTKLKQETERELLTTSITKENSYGPLALFSSWRLSLNTVMICISWVCITLCYTVLLMSAGEKSDGNPFLDFAWQSAAEMPGNILAAWLCDRYGRRFAGASSFFISAFIWILTSFGHLAWMQTWWMPTVILMVNRLFINVTYYVLSLLNMEIYPTCLRQSGMSFGNVLSSGAAIISPYIVYLGHRVDRKLPGIILAATSLVGVISVLILPETLNVTLPETLEDAKAFGKYKKKNGKLEPVASDEKDTVIYVATDN